MDVFVGLVLGAGAEKTGEKDETQRERTRLKIKKFGFMLKNS